LEEDHPDRPGAEVDRGARVVDVRDAADLDLCGHRRIVENNRLAPKTRQSAWDVVATYGTRFGDCCWRLWSALCGRLPSVTVAVRCFWPRSRSSVTLSPGFFPSTIAITS